MVVAQQKITHTATGATYNKPKNIAFSSIDITCDEQEMKGNKVKPNAVINFSLNKPGGFKKDAKGIMYPAKAFTVVDGKGKIMFESGDINTLKEVNPKEMGPWITFEMMVGLDDFDPGNYTIKAKFYDTKSDDFLLIELPIVVVK